MGHSLDIRSFHGRQQGLDVNAGGGEQGLPQGGASQLFIRLGQDGLVGLVISADAEDLAHQGEPVGVHAGGLHTQQHVPGLQAGAVHNLFLVHNAHGEARQIVIVGSHHAGVFGSLPADEGAAGLNAAFRHAGYDLGDLLRKVLPTGDVVQKEQGLSAAAHHVVDAHGHGVDADGVVLIQQHGDLQLGAHTVGAGDQHRLLHAGKVRGEQAPKPPDAGDHPGDHRALDVLFHQLYGFVPRGHVHARGLIAVTVAFHWVIHSLNSCNIPLTGPRCRFGRWVPPCRPG